MLDRDWLLPCSLVQDWFLVDVDITGHQVIGVVAANSVSSLLGSIVFFLYRLTMHIIQ